MANKVKAVNVKAKPKDTEESLLWKLHAICREYGLDSERAIREMRLEAERFAALWAARQTKSETAKSSKKKNAKTVSRPIERREVGHQYQNEDSLEGM